MRSISPLLRLMRYSFYSVTIQLMFCGLVLATEPGNAQGKVEHVKDVIIDLSLNQDDLISSFRKIESKTEFHFVFDKKDIDDNVRISNEYRDQSVYEILLDLSKKADLGFRQINENISVKKYLSTDDRVEIAQDILITGIVRDEFGEGLVGVTIQVKGTTIGTVTDINGQYRLNVPDENVILVFSFIGYTPYEVRVGQQSVIDVDMRPDVQALEEVVVVGYGTQIKRNVSSSIATVDVEKINSAAVNSFEGGLQGIAAGVQVTTSSAMGGSAIRIRVRGTSSASANSEPLYVIDGIPMEGGGISTSQPGRSVSEWNLQQAANTNVLASINPADIESIEVLKDAAAAAIYGSRGANGVVLITTKGGKAGKTQVRVSGSFGISDATHRIELLNAEEYIQLAQKAWYNGGNSIEDFWTNSGVLVDGLTQEEAENTDTDWVDEVLQIGKVQDYNVSLSGGNEKTTFYLSANLKDQETILRGNRYQRFGTRINVDHQLNDIFKIGGKMMLTHVDDDQVPASWAGGVSNVSEMLPIWPVRKADGTYFYLTNEHPVAGVDLRIMNLVSDQILGNWFVSADILEGLNFRTEFGTSLLFNHDFHYRDGRITDHGRTVSSTVNGVRSSWNFKNILNYKRSFGDHNFDFLAAIDAQSFHNRTNFIFGDTYINSTLTRPSDAAIKNAGLEETDYSFLSYIGRINYDLNGRYLISVSMRADGSSRFAKKNRWGYFPAISTGWVISDEAFFQPLAGIINFFKLRASYGRVGNAEIGDFSYVSNYGTITYDGNTGVVLGNLGDDKLGWETTSQLDIGVTWEILNGRISGEFDYYDKTTTDLLLPFPTSQMTGVASVTKNVGELTNVGFDVMVNSINIDNNIFSWETNLTLNHNENEVVKLGDELVSEGLSASAGLSSISIFPGYPVGVLEGVKWAGVDPTTGQDTYFDSEGNLLSYSEIIDQYISFGNFVQEHKEPIGNPWPKLSGGIDNRFTYKNFYANFLFTFSTGQTFADGYMKQLHAPFGGEKVNPATDVLGAWNAPGDQAEVSQLNTNNVEWPWTTEFIYETDYVRLKDLTIGYRFGMDNTFLRGVDVYTKLINALTFTKAPDFFWDPEFTPVEQHRAGGNIGAGTSFKQIPQAKTFMVGVSIDF